MFMKGFIFIQCVAIWYGNQHSLFIYLQYMYHTKVLSRFHMTVPRIFFIILLSWRHILSISYPYHDVTFVGSHIPPVTSHPFHIAHASPTLWSHRGHDVYMTLHNKLKQEAVEKNLYCARGKAQCIKRMHNKATLTKGNWLDICNLVQSVSCLHLYE